MVADRIIAQLKAAGIEIPQKEIQLHNFVLQDEIDMITTLEKLIYALDPSKANYEPNSFHVYL